MANYSANIQLVVQGQDRLKYVLNSVEKLNTILSRLKPINLLAPGRGAGADVIGQAKKQLDDFSRAVVNFKPEGIQKRAKELSNTLAGSAAQADALTIALENVGLKQGGFSKQAAEVKNYALALEQARRNAERLNVINQQVQRGARIQTIAQKFNVSPEVVEQRLNNIREARYAKDRQAEAARFMALKREEDFELRLQRIREKNALAQQKQTENRERVSNVALGAGFPLLFGGGPGAVIGGGLGGLFSGPGAFAAQIGLSALGQQLDLIRQNAAEFAKALREGGDAVSFLETNLGAVDPETKTLIRNLQQSGQTARAATAAFEVMSDAIGRENAEALRKAGEEASGYSNILNRLALSFTAAGYRANDFFNNLKRNPLGVETPFVEKSLQSLFPKQTTSGQNSVTAEATQRTKTLKDETDILQTQATLTTLSLKNNLDLFVYASQRLIQQERLAKQAEIEYQYKQGQISPEQRLLQLSQTRLNAQISLNNLERQRIEELQRRQEEAARKAEEAARKQEQTVKNILGLQIELSQVTLEAADVDVSRTTAIEGQLAGAKESLSQQQMRLNVEGRILDLQLEQKLLSADLSAQEKELLTSVYNQQRANLEGQAQTKARLLQLDIARLEAARAIAATESPRQLQDIRQQRVGQLARVQAQLANPFGGAALDTTNQQLEQLTRTYETLTPLEQKLTDLQTERTNIAASASKEELAVLDQRISGAVAAIELEKQYLSQLNASEQALLKQQQTYEKYGFIANEISAAFSDSISGIITGTTTVAEAFSRMFENIGKAFIDMATQLLAQQLFMTVLGALGGGITGGNPAGSGGNVLPGGWQQYAFAEGGFVTGPTRALIGEGGEPEYVIPASKMRTAMSRYAAGARGSSVIPSGSDDGATMGATMTAAPIDVRYTVERINSVDYVTADQFQAGMRQAASQGAERGQQLALRRLQQSPSTRRRLGI